MNFSTTLSRLFRKYTAECIVLLLSTITLSIAGVIVYHSYLIGQETVIEIKDTEAIPTPVEASEVKITVDVSGAVMNPSIYKVKPGTRIFDVLILAGGLSPQADTEYIARNYNMTLFVENHEKLHFPSIGEMQKGVFIEEPRTLTYLSNDSEGDIVTSAPADTATININTADTAALDSLPGIGEKTAEKIIQNRPYQKIEDLIDKKVITQKVLDSIKDSISL